MTIATEIKEECLITTNITYTPKKNPHLVKLKLGKVVMLFVILTNKHTGNEGAAKIISVYQGVDISHSCT